MVKIEIKSLSFSYSSHKILDDVNLAVQDSEIVSLVGPNGSGKTTLIKCIDRILRPKGSIFLEISYMYSMPLIFLIRVNDFMCIFRHIILFIDFGYQ